MSHTMSGWTDGSQVDLFIAAASLLWSEIRKKGIGDAIHGDVPR